MNHKGKVQILEVKALQGSFSLPGPAANVCQCLNATAGLCFVCEFEVEKHSLPALGGQDGRLRVWVSLPSAALSVYLSPHLCLVLLQPPRAVTHNGERRGKKSGPSVGADGDLWTVDKLQSLSEQRCPKYVIQIDQSGWKGAH